MDYRQQQAAAARARLFELQAEQLKKQAEIDQAMADCEMYNGASQPPPAAAPVPNALPLPVAAPKSGWTFGQVVGVMTLVAFSFFAGSAWVATAKQHRDVDARDSWYNGASLAPEYSR